MGGEEKQPAKGHTQIRGQPAPSMYLPHASPIPVHSASSLTYYPGLATRLTEGSRVFINAKLTRAPPK